MPNIKLKQLKTYELTLRDIHDEKIGKLHELSVSVGWPHRPDDWRMLLKLGKGFTACDKIGRIVGSSMWFPMSNDFATIGMVITSPLLQSQGSGRWLMDQISELCRNRRLQANVPQAALHLYNALGFKPVAVVHQHQGRAVDPGEMPAPPGSSIRQVKHTDLDDISRLDKAAFGTDRHEVLTELIGRSKGSVLECNGRVVGFSLCRPFGRGHVVGPVVARDSAEAIALTAPFVTLHAESFLRVDTAQGNSEFTDFLCRCGMPEVDQLTTMSSNPRADADTEVHTFALASHTFG